MMDTKAKKLICRLLGDKKDMRVLEWGAGGSTLFYSQFAKAWNTVEKSNGFFFGNAKFGKEFSDFMKGMGEVENVWLDWRGLILSIRCFTCLFEYASIILS